MEENGRIFFCNSLSHYSLKCFRFTQLQKRRIYRPLLVAAGIAPANTLHAQIQDQSRIIQRPSSIVTSNSQDDEEIRKKRGTIYVISVTVQYKCSYA